MNEVPILSLGQQHIEGGEVAFDLHGTTVREAKTLLPGIFRAAQDNNLRSVTLIAGAGTHSKNGFGVLSKKIVPNFLKRPDIREQIQSINYDRKGAFEVVFKREDQSMKKVEFLQKTLQPFAFPDNEFTVVKQKAEQGSVDDLFNLGIRYLRGYGTTKNRDQGIAYLIQAAEAGHTYSKHYLGLLHEVGDDVKQSHRKAIQWYKKAAKDGDPDSLFKLGSYFWTGKEVVKNDRLALDYLSRAAEKGQFEAAYNLGCILLEEDFGVHDPVRGQNLLEQAAREGICPAQVTLGRQYFLGFWKTSIDYKKAYQWFQKAARKGDSTAEYYLGRIYYEGLGVASNEQTALFWFQKSAENGDLDAKLSCVLIGLKDDNNLESIIKQLEELANAGHGQSATFLAELHLGYWNKELKVNFSLAKKYLELAARKGFGRAQTLLSILHLSEKFENSSKEAALYWLKKAAEKGEAKALYWLGLLHLDGDIADKNVAKGLDFLKRAAKKGDGNAIFELGAIYLEGEIIEKDEIRGLAMLQKAAKRKMPEAQVYLGRYLIESKLKSDHEAAVSYFASAALQKSIPAMILLAFCYRFGSGVASDLKKTLHWLDQAYSAGSGYALYLKSRTLLEHNQAEEGFACALKAARKGEKSALVLLAQIYASPNNKSKEAHKHAQKVISLLKEFVKSTKKKGLLELALGVIYLDPSLGHLNIKLALHWLDQSLAHDQDAAAYYLCQIYGSYPQYQEQTLQILTVRARKNQLSALRVLVSLAVTDQLSLDEKVIEKAKTMKDGLTAFNLAQILIQKQRCPEAKQLLDSNVPALYEEQNHEPELAYAISTLYRFVGEIETVILWLEKAADQNHPMAAYDAACLYYSLVQTSRNPSRATEQNMMTAPFLQAWDYQSGPSLEEKAFKLFQLAADLGVAPAQFFLAKIYKKGKLGVSQDPKKAHSWLLKAARNGSLDAEFTLGSILLTNSPPFSLEKAEGFNWLLGAAQKGDVEAMFVVATAYQNGDGTQKNLADAWKWYEKAANAGYKEALDRLNLEDFTQHEGPEQTSTSNQPTTSYSDYLPSCVVM